MTEACGVWDVGYEGKSVEELIEILLGWQVATLVDVRLNAISRKKGFSKKALRSALEEAGMGYLHLPALGNPKDNRAGFASPGTPAADEAHERFRHCIDSAEAHEALQIVEDLAQAGGVALLCFEADHRTCHRSLIAQTLRDRSLLSF
ncbi:DUF488 domain-containing protein [Kocuria turfanensis]|uniref:DUF488 domain-containing protein n=1 Tax=Kocuria turfanensis TaxID=388357 RepID=UPI0040370409